MLKRLGVIGLVLVATSGVAFAEADRDQEQGWLGIHLGKTSSVLQRHLGLGENTGFVIMKVMEDTPAERAGLQAHDVVTAINGQEVNGVKEAVESITSSAPGDTVSITLLRDGVAVFPEGTDS